MTYPEGEEELRAKSRELSDQVDAITAAYWDLEGETLAQRAARELFEEGYRWPGGPQEPEEAVQVQAETVDPM